ncbi:MAG TPA: hypothetical protein VNK73_06120 [Actinomycetota bacterium]|jgi:hypothetical protein|nr:hypothetical protein [Actinomycetota bacterium]
MKGHAPAAYLRVYQALAAFAPAERAEWAAYVESGDALPSGLLVGREEERALARALGLPLPSEREHALVQRVGQTVYVCPLRTELRTLQSLLAFHGSLPREVADAFVSSGEVARAASTLERLQRERPASRNHIRLAVWYVPLPWFALFDGAERKLAAPEADHLALLTYQTTMVKAQARVSRALRVLQEVMEDGEVVAAVEELRDWLYGFDSDSLVQLDYGGLARVLPYPELAEDQSAAEVWEALEALEEGDLERSSAHYGALTERWAALRGRESSN